jgi:hypothetical protein
MSSGREGGRVINHKFWEGFCEEANTCDVTRQVCSEKCLLSLTENPVGMHRILEFSLLHIVSSFRTEQSLSWALSIGAFFFLCEETCVVINFKVVSAGGFGI